MLPRHAAAPLACLGLLYLLPVLRAADWPTWRRDMTRSSASPQQLPARLHLQWVRVYPPLTPAWPDQPKLQFDTVYEPVVAGKTLFIGSSRTDSVTALDTATGTERWRFHADGPVRFAPTVWEGRVYFVCDDGHLYCVSADRGRLLWKVRGGPSDRRVLGNGRLISTWPARGAPAIHEGKLYFAASIWPFMGVFIHCLDARTGEPVWTNDGDGSIYIKQPHQADSFAGVAPQGHFVVAGGRLLIPGGRSVPACYDLKTGKLLRYQLAENGKRGGGAAVVATGKLFFNGGAAFDLVSQKFLSTFGDPVVVDGGASLWADHTGYTWADGACRAIDLGSAGEKEEETVDRKGKKITSSRWKAKALGACKTPKPEVLIKAALRLYLGAAGRVFALDLPLTEGAKPSWEARVEGTVASLVAADDRLFAVTREGRIYAFGAQPAEPVTHQLPEPPGAPADAWAARARALLEASGVRDGYAVAWGVGSGRLVVELTRQSRLHLIVVERDPRKVSELRDRLTAAGLYGHRVAVHEGDPLTFPLPPYLASLMVAEDLHSAGIEPTAAFVRKAFHALRPYGGVACLPLETGRRAEFARAVAESKLAGARVAESPQGVLLTRAGALPGAGDWTHEHADESNTRVSKDRLVKAPLGVLWFGGTSNEGVLPRHGHGPQPQVIDGRMFVEGVDMMRALDIYTGRLLWEAPLPSVGAFYDNTLHQPGANGSGTNYISTRDGIYVAYGESCVKLDPATGKKIATFALPVPAGGKASRWGYINVAGDYLIGGGEPLFDLQLAKYIKPSSNPAPPDADPGVKKKSKDSALTRVLKKLRGSNDNLSSSKELIVLDRHTGKLLWRVKARAGFRHNAICIGGGRLYAIDRLSGPEEARIKRRGEEPKLAPRLVVFDLKTGKQLWATEADVFGTWLSYSAKHDVLVEAGRVARDTISDEPYGMRAYRAATGKVLWDDEDAAGPAMIHGDMILQDRSACDLLTGEPKMRTHPLTGLPVPWTWVRNYGCNTPMASEHLLTFRSGAAGYFDLCGDSGTGNFGGFRSSCTNNLVVAGGVLTAPDYTRTCVCAYQNQTSLALVHMPENEMWTTFGTTEIKGTIKRLGINLGAPGDRKDDSGTLWLECPSVAGKSPAIKVKVAPAEAQYFRRHQSAVQGDGLRWVGASGVKGVQSVHVSLAEKPVKLTYTVRLHFVEPDRLPAGKRVFNVALQGKEVLKDFDIAREAGGRNRVVVREFRGVPVRNGLTVTFQRSPFAPIGAAVLCGIEVRAEE
jgi:outer membrane protein assembly factor BamB